MRIFCIVCSRWRDWGDASGPDLILIDTGAGDLPDLFRAKPADFIENGLGCWARRDEDVVGKEFDIGVGHCGRKER